MNHSTARILSDHSGEQQAGYGIWRDHLRARTLMDHERVEQDLEMAARNRWIIVPDQGFVNWLTY